MQPAEARAIIADGNAEMLVAKASELARQTDATPTSVRRLYGEVKRIQLMWQHDDGRAPRRSVLLQPRMAYQGSRDPKLRALVPALNLLHAEVKGDRERFDRFAEFFEALVAYMRGR